MGKSDALGRKGSDRLGEGWVTRSAAAQEVFEIISPHGQRSRVYTGSVTQEETEPGPTRAHLEVHRSLMHRGPQAIARGPHPPLCTRSCLQRGAQDSGTRGGVVAREPGTRVDIDPGLEARVLRVGEEYLDALLRGEAPDGEE